MNKQQQFEVCIESKETNDILYIVSEEFDSNDIVINIYFDFKEYEDYLRTMNVYNVEYKSVCEHFETKCLFKKNIFSVDDTLEAYANIEGV
jgi:hypothetical protein